MDIENLQHIRWACRRGMLELDLILLSFFDEAYVRLSSEEKQSFVILLQEADPDLLNWLMGYAKPAAEFESIVHTIRQYVQNKT